MSTVLVSPDSFKGTFSAVQVAEALARGLSAAGVDADLCPVADGGEGTLDALTVALGANLHPVTVSDPLGRPVDASFALKDDLAIVETAAASGLNLVEPDERDALAASSAGTGELIAAAVHAGARTIYLGVGGSATTDGGAGAIRTIEEMGGLGGARLVVLCDVHTAFEEAPRVFAPQKGASAEDVERLSARLSALADSYPRDPRGVEMAGAAGGLSGGLWAAFGAELVSGAGFVLDAVRFDERVAAAVAVITGEGKLDGQSRAGKLVSVVAERAGRTGAPCHAVVGINALDASGARSLGLARVLEASTLVEIEAAGRQLAATI